MQPAREVVPSARPEDVVAEFERLTAGLAAARRALRGVVFGQDAAVEQALTAVVAGGHVILSGAPGVAKSRLADALGAVLGVSVGRAQLTAATTPDGLFAPPLSDLEARRLRPDGGPAARTLLIAEDLDRASPAMVAAVIEAMDGGAPIAGGARWTPPSPWHLVGSAGADLRGLEAWSESWIDRFLIRIDMGFPPRADERLVLIEGGRGAPVLNPALDADRLLRAQRLAVELPVGEDVVQTILELVRRCRPEEPAAPAMVRGVVLRGPGPRAGQALMRLVRARALVDGRPSPSRADVEAMAAPALRHRLAPYPAPEKDRVSADRIVAEVLAGL